MSIRTTHIIPAAIFTLLLIWFTFNWTGLSTQSSTPPEVNIKPAEEEPFYDIPTKGRLFGHNGIANLTNPHIQFAKVNIAVSQSDMAEFPLLQILDIKLPASANINIDEISEHNSLELESTVSTTIRIPRLPHTQPDAHEYIFGVATTYDRLLNSLDTFSHWLSNSNTRLIAAMEPSLDLDLPDKVLAKAQSLKIPLGTIDSPYQFLDRYFSLIRVLHDNRSPDTKWYVLIDDDTFFLDLANVVKTFKAKYNPDLPYYIGALTEDFQQMSTWGYMAYGGGGVFLSAPLVEQLLPHWEACYAKRNTGDQRLAECIYQHTNTKFTWEHNLHQLDLHGDQSGFYEALRPQPLSVHHWKSDEFRFHADMYNLSLVSTICGKSCLLQKFKFANGWVLTNGFSLVKHSDVDVRHRDVDKDISMERTWDFYWGGASNIHFEHSVGPIRNPDEGEKISFRMESALKETDGRVRQLYVKRKKKEEGDERPGPGEVEGVVEIEWSMA
ncbi:hypothetical protein LTS08_007405 [Lithohypha guttulata]|uniref:Glycosyltransferase family 31 protein n=1 Tax=Lithohypha guttulata TaxID=1690604 RepID=A0AAN7T6Z8_9EURO|nr:hypothetical protein LTR05_000205 [Lithohypha guttulata]KAK5096915.1 hypothetical protein LTS08_007405 [Lithohypha guttulata]